MAKTFKNLSRAGKDHLAKPTSERDFFDLSDEPRIPESIDKEEEIISNTGNTNNKGITGNKSNTSTATLAKSESTKPLADPTARDVAAGVRQTFILSREHLEQLRDYVHARRSAGEYAYSQRQALEDALDLLFASVPPIPQRPEQARQRERQRGERIKRGRAQD